MVSVRSIEDDQKLAAGETKHSLLDHHQDSAATNKNPNILKLQNRATNRAKTGEMKVKSM